MKQVATVIAAMAVATSANAVVFDFSTPQGNLGPTETYTVSGLSIVASGFSAPATPVDLWGKQDGGNENGLGLANDPQHEIHFGSGFVQLDVINLFGQVVAGSTFFGTNSTTEGEAWAVYGTNTAGTTVGGTLVSSGSTEGNHLLPFLGTYRYYDFVETSQLGGQNFLITSITTTPIPEPAAWALMLLGFGGLGALLRRRRVMALAAA